jgi:fructose-1,6-bisphosphatase/inositol monophosphatase family enzyme
MSQLDEWLAFAVHAARLAGESILPYFRASLQIDNKAREGFDPVTQADREAESVIRRDPR